MKKGFPGLGLLLLAAACAGPSYPPVDDELIRKIHTTPGLSGHRPWGIQWSPDGKYLCWLEGKSVVGLDVRSGERKVLATIPRGRRPKGIGRRSGRSYHWSPDGKRLLLHAGYQLHLDRPLTKSKKEKLDPKWSADGQFIYYVREHDLWRVSVDGGAERQITSSGSESMLNGEPDWVYPEELKVFTGYHLNPKSDLVAFLQLDQSSVQRFPIPDFRSISGSIEWMRYPKAGSSNPVAKIGLVMKGEIVWPELPPDSEYVARMDWTPDGGLLLVQTLNRAQDTLQVLAYDPEEDEMRPVFLEKLKGWVRVHDNLVFFNDSKRFLWTSERDGWNHLYLVNLDGTSVQLTRGNWNVGSVLGMDEQSGWAYYTSGEADPMERHLYRVDLSGKRERLTAQGGTHSIRMSPDFTHYVDTWSTVDQPSKMELVRMDDGKRTILSTPPKKELKEMAVKQQLIVLPSGDKSILPARVYLPPGFNYRGEHPLLVHVYGGPGSQLVKNSWGGSNHLWHSSMAIAGFLVVIMDHRASAWRGRDNVRAMHGRLGAIEVEDIVAGVQALKKLPFVDENRVAIWGWSYGGYLACLAMTKTDEFAAGIAVAPVTDWRYYDTIYTERYMGLPRKNKEGYRESSPLTHAKNLHGRLLLVHGMADGNVHWQNTEAFLRELILAGKDFETLVYPGRRHGIGDTKARIHLFTRMARFLERSLAP
jgi:dipeptidyl-peptidase-4